MGLGAVDVLGAKPPGEEMVWGETTRIQNTVMIFNDLSSSLQNNVVHPYHNDNKVQMICETIDTLKSAVWYTNIFMRYRKNFLENQNRVRISHDKRAVGIQ